MKAPRPRLAAARVRLIVITDAELASPRSLEAVVEAALRAGAPCIQLRDKTRTVNDLLPLASRLRGLTRKHDALLFVNDRLDLALAAGADGVHVGPDDLPVAAVRDAVPNDFLIGFSADDPEEAIGAENDGADYIGCGAVWPTSSKADAGKAIGLRGLSRVVRAVDIPVVAIGGVSEARGAPVAATGAAGVAVIGAVMGPEHPGEAVRQLLAGLEPPPTRALS